MRANTVNPTHRTYADGDTFTRDGVLFRVKFRTDDTDTAPWEEHDGHGPVSDWTTRDKAPGELVLAADRGSKRFYDFAAAVAMAKRDGWGHGDDVPGETPGQKATRAALADFEYLRGWCCDDWCYIGVIVEALENDGEELATESLWRVESNGGAYVSQVVEDLTASILADLAKTAAAAAEKATAKAARLQAIVDRLTNGEGAQV